MPPEVTSTACAPNWNSPIGSRELGRPRSTPLGPSNWPRTPSSTPPVLVSSSTRCRNSSRTRPSASACRTRRMNGSSTPGPGAPGDVEARHRVAVPGRQVATALGPADHREEPNALCMQPGTLLTGREVQVRLGPLPGPVVGVPVEAGGAQPVLPGQFQRVGDPQSALLGGVDQEQPTEGPEGLAAQALLRLLVEQQHGTAGIGQLRGRDQAGQAGTDHDHIRISHGHTLPAGNRSGIGRLIRT